MGLMRVYCQSLGLKRTSSIDDSQDHQKNRKCLTWRLNKKAGKHRHAIASREANLFALKNSGRNIRDTKWAQP